MLWGLRVFGMVGCLLPCSILVAERHRAMRQALEQQSSRKPQIVLGALLAAREAAPVQAHLPPRIARRW